MAFAKIASVPGDPIFGVVAAFLADPRPEKINLSIGVYQNEDGEVPMLRCVKRAEEELFQKEKNKNYLPIDGDPLFIEQSGQLVFGKELFAHLGSGQCGAQTVGGTSALRLGIDLLIQAGVKEAALPDPTWPNHQVVFARPEIRVAHYPYYAVARHGIDFDRLYQHLEALSPGAVVLLHAACHNPTGVDFSETEWKRLAPLFVAKKLVPFFDSAYLGFGESLDEDAWPIRHFARLEIPMLVALSYSKNYSLYGERVGALFVVSHHAETSLAIKSQLKRIIRGLYSNPPMHGAKIVAHILSTPGLRDLWEKELSAMRLHLREMRKQFTAALLKKSKRDFHFLQTQRGLFSYTGLTKKEVDLLREQFAIYMTSDGRMNVAGITPKNLHRIVEAITTIMA